MTQPSKSISTRATGSVANVANAYINIPVVVPKKGKVRRVRAAIIAGGTGSPTISCEIRENATGTGFGTILAYAAATNPIDSEESVMYSAEDIAGDLTHGTLYVAVKTDHAVADHPISISLDIDITY